MGEGSTFRFKVPLTVPEKKDNLEKEAQAESQMKSRMEDLRGKRVLVAEDNNINQIIMEELLKPVGIEVTFADNGIQALEMLSKYEFDIILMDVQMPEMDGLAATAQIRTEPRYANLPILAMTANARAEHIEESISAGMNAHLTKPVDTEQLYNALIKWTVK